MSATPHSPDPVGTLVRLMLRTLWMLYAGFWFSLVLYALVLLVLPTLMGDGPLGGPRGVVRQLPDNWDQWQFFFAAAGVVALYISYRLRLWLLNPQRVRRGASNIYELAETLQPGGSSPEEGPGVDRTESAVSPEVPPGAENLGRAVQDLLGRTAMGYVVLWALVEIPAVLGVVDSLISGDLRLFVGLGILAAIGLYIHRPSRDRIAEILGPVAR